MQISIGDVNFYNELQNTTNLSKDKVNFNFYFYSNLSLSY